VDSIIIFSKISTVKRLLEKMEGQQLEELISNNILSMEALRHPSNERLQQEVIAWGVGMMVEMDLNVSDSFVLG
jgi:hypothetical protein